MLDVMSGMPHQPPSVYRLLSRTPEDARALSFDDTVPRPGTPVPSRRLTGLLGEE
jgi:hypothetical protein